MLNFNEYVELRLDIIDDESYTESETSAMLDTLDNNYPEYYEAVCEYDKIQVLREAVEERFLNDELDYEEYAMVIDRLDEKESYLEAKVDDHLVPKFKKYLSDLPNFGCDPEDLSKAEMIKLIRLNRKNGHSEWGASKSPKNSKIHDNINKYSNHFLTDKEYSKEKDRQNKIDKKLEELGKAYDKQIISGTTYSKLAAELSKKKSKKLAEHEKAKTMRHAEMVVRNAKIRGNYMKTPKVDENKEKDFIKKFSNSIDTL